VRAAIDDAILELAANPREVGKQLRGTLRGIWTFRVGEYRLLYRIVGSMDQDLVIDSVLHRPEGYPRSRH
jgi:mRNA-degrading endonuclease RelE of RelBE toxin-antitoxin system